MKRAQFRRSVGVSAVRSEDDGRRAAAPGVRPPLRRMVKDQGCWLRDGLARSAEIGSGWQCGPAGGQGLAEDAGVVFARRGKVVVAGVAGRLLVAGEARGTIRVDVGLDGEGLKDNRQQRDE